MLGTNAPELPRPCRWLISISRPRLLFALIAAYLFVLFILFPAFAGSQNVVPLDLRFHYDLATVRSVFDALGMEGRDQYRVGAMTLDVLYPLVYSSTFAVWLALLVRARTRFACATMLLPFAVLLFDLLENACIVMLLAQYPDLSGTLVAVAAWLTSLKWSLAAATIATVSLLTLRAGYEFLRSRTS